MALGFKKSLFGFNCEDVMSYIESSHSEFARKEKEFEEKLERLSKIVDENKLLVAKAIEEKNKSEEKLNEYVNKYNDIDRLSKNIGKLYLVAQTNAKSIIKTSEESAKLSKMEVEKNLTSISDAHSSLESLREEVRTTLNDFEKKVSELLNSLDVTKNRINENNQVTKEMENSFNSVYAELTR